MSTTRQLPLSKANLIAGLVGYLVFDWVGALFLFIIPYSSAVRWMNRPIKPRPVTTTVPYRVGEMPEAASMANLQPVLTALDLFFQHCRNDCATCPHHIPNQPCPLIMSIYPSMPVEGVSAYFHALWLHLDSIRGTIDENNRLRRIEVFKDQLPVRALYLGSGAAIMWTVYTIMSYLSALAGAL